MWYYLIVNEAIVASSTERDVCVANQTNNEGSIISDSNFYSETDYIYSNGAFAARSKPTEELEQERRQERSMKFAQTLDLMNGAWYDTLTAQEKTDLATWRTAWLDYPSTGTKPDDLDLFG